MTSFFKPIPLLVRQLNPHGCHSSEHILEILKNKVALRKALDHIKVYKSGQYIHDHFTHWVSAYAKHSPTFLQDYFADKLGLTPICHHFIQFCFANGIALNKEETLRAFDSHNAISDGAVKRELQQFGRKDKVHILGFGLGDGSYEKTIGRYLIEQRMAKSVKVFGFDPFASKTDDIEFLTSEQLTKDRVPKFDLIIARWVLHHVVIQQRWADLVNCINRSKPGAIVLIVEHGFLLNGDRIPLLDKKLYHLLNAQFDIVANIGIRPEWFTSTAQNIGANFFIHYMYQKDFMNIKSKLTKTVQSKIYDVGPGFPNQTICCLRVQL